MQNLVAYHERLQARIGIIIHVIHARSRPAAHYLGSAPRAAPVRARIAQQTGVRVGRIRSYDYEVVAHGRKSRERSDRLCINQ